MVAHSSKIFPFITSPIYKKKKKSHIGKHNTDFIFNFQFACGFQFFRNEASFSVGQHSQNLGDKKDLEEVQLMKKESQKENAVEGTENHIKQVFNWWSFYCIFLTFWISDLIPQGFICKKSDNFQMLLKSMETVF